MTSDISKIKFDEDKHYSKVNFQQGSILLDSDLNEGSEILNYHHRTSLQDIIGKCGVPAENPGFKVSGNTAALFAWENITVENNSDNEKLRDFVRYNFAAKWLDDLQHIEPHKLFVKSSDGKTISATSGNQGQDIDIVLSDDNTAASLSVDSNKKYNFIVKKGEDNKTYIHSKWYRIGAGHCYINGILVQNEAEVEGSRQPDFPMPFPQDGAPISALPRGESGRYLVYLRGWERVITPLQDPEIAEKAVGNANTTTRTKVVWQVCVAKVPHNTICSSALETCDNNIQPSSCKLRARSKPTTPINEPCQLPPGAGYRGLENQLYRIEIHNSGVVGSGATFKWSRDNGAHYARVLEFSPGQLTISSIGTDLRLGFAPGNLVEVLDTKHELWGVPGTLVKIKEVKDNNTLILEEGSINGDDLTDQNFPQEFSPLVRRWDCSDLIPVHIPSGGNTQGYIALEDGVQIKFDADGTCKTGDHWRITARTAIADVEWPKMGGNSNTPIAKLPEGIKYHYCRLALINYDTASGMISVVEDCRRIFSSLTEARDLATTATTGIVTLNFGGGLLGRRGYFFGPFIHSLGDLENPPAIILALANSENLQTRVKFMEDYALARVPDTEAGLIQFKAVNIGLQEFLVSVTVPEDLHAGRFSIPIRWYALPAQQKPEQNSDEIPKLNFMDKEFNPITELPPNDSGDNSFMIRLYDPVLGLISPSTEKIEAKITIRNDTAPPSFNGPVECTKLETGVFILKLNNTPDGLFIVDDPLHPRFLVEISDNGRDQLAVRYVHRYDCSENTVSIRAGIKRVPPIIL
jgi:hypothetical protein